MTKKAQAEAAAKKAHADGDKALQMVPVEVVEVAKEQVGVKQREVEVLQQELEARAQHGAAAQQFEIEKLRISKDAEVRIAGAQAMATFGGKIEATVVGTPEDVSRMTQAYMKGMCVSRAIDGFFSAAGPEPIESLDGVGQALASLVAAATRRGKADEAAALKKGDSSGPDPKK